MFKEIKYLIFISIICLFIFLISRYYFSDTNKKNSYRSLNNINEKIDTYAEKLPVLKDDTKNIIDLLNIKFNITTQNEGDSYSGVIGPIENIDANKLVSSFISKGYKNTEIILK